MLCNTNKGWATFCIIPLSYNVFTYLLGKYDVELERDPPFLCLDAVGFILIISAYVLILRFFKQTRQQLIIQSEQEVLKTQLSAAQTHLAALKESEKKTLIYRHDLHHHLNLINGYLADNKLDEVKKYITEVEKSIDNTDAIKYCDNDAVNLILTSSIKRAKQENIAVESQPDIAEDCHVSDMDLCIILSNAIENAINACTNITDSSERKITVSCRSKIDKLFIQVTNNFIGEVKFADDMPIRNEENLGFGTRSIVSTVQKYNGLCSFTTEDGVFKVRIIL
jgi:sensor histidine kinase regulating citrate/malate metabolism